MEQGLDGIKTFDTGIKRLTTCIKRLILVLNVLRLVPVCDCTHIDLYIQYYESGRAGLVSVVLRLISVILRLGPNLIR